MEMGCPYFVGSILKASAGVTQQTYGLGLSGVVSGLGLVQGTIGLIHGWVLLRGRARVLQRIWGLKCKASFQGCCRLNAFNH